MRPSRCSAKPRVKPRNLGTGGGFRDLNFAAGYVPAEPGTKSLELIAVSQPEKHLACFPIEGKPGAGISPVIGDLDRAHGHHKLIDCQPSA